MFLKFIGETLLWGAVAIIGHELAHAVTAVALGRRVGKIDLLSLEVQYVLPAEGFDWRDKAIGVAPLVSGLTLALAAVILGWRVSAPMWIGLAIYTLNGGLDDLRNQTVVTA